jgi:hypothetical protein
VRGAPDPISGSRLAYQALATLPPAPRPAG